jgi:MFS transporter, DHA1 family, L-arabinose/isopropyl-beta-D-thiogalactopyranoside export protein
MAQLVEHHLAKVGVAGSNPVVRSIMNSVTGSIGPVTLFSGGLQSVGMSQARAKMTLREWLPLLGIAVSAFIFNTSEFMPVGLLTDIGATFGTTEGETGIMVSVYAWAVMLLSVPLMILATRIPFRPLILAVLAVFCAGQVFSALAPNFGALIAARLVVACAHSVFWAIAAPLAARLVDESHGAMAVSLVITGSSLAMIVGLPIGRVIGLAMGWRLTFACVAGVALVVLAFLLVVFPRLQGATTFRMNQLPSIMKNKVLVGVFVMTALYPMGYFTCYSYIEPFLLQVGGMPDGLVTTVLVVFGVAGLVGSAICTRFYTAKSVHFPRLAIAGVAVAILLLRFCVVSAPLTFAVCVLWGISSSAYQIVYQAKIIEVADESEQTVATAMFSGIFNLGIGTGSFIGGLVCTYDTIGDVGFVGAAIAALALAYCVFVWGRARARACGKDS